MKMNVNAIQEGEAVDLKYIMSKTAMDVHRIKDYIVGKYPECCLAHNSKHRGYYEEELIGECEDFFYFEKLNWCGCGDQETAKRVIRDYLRILYDYKKDEDFDNSYNRKKKSFQDRFNADSVYDNELLLCLAYALDAAGFTEHGSSIGGAWTTDEGDMFLWLLNQNEDLDSD